MGTYRDYTETEEKLNFGTHFVALIFYIFAAPYLIYSGIQAGHQVNIAGLVVFSVGLIAVFSSSSLYHYTKDRDLKIKYRTMDHMAIFLLIGGTYTPVISKYIEPTSGTIFMTVLWSILIGGIFMKFFFMGRFKLFSIFLYVFLGCMVIYFINPILENMPKDVFNLILGGGLCYLIGVLFYIQKKREYTHTIWHIFVMAASFCHFLAIYKIALSS